MATQTVPEPKYLHHERRDTESASSAKHRISMKHLKHFYTFQCRNTEEIICQIVKKKMHV